MNVFTARKYLQNLWTSFKLSRQRAAYRANNESYFKPNPYVSDKENMLALERLQRLGREW